MFIHFGVKGTVRKAVWIDDKRTLKTKKRKTTTTTTISSETVLSVLATILKFIVLIKIFIKLLQL